MYKKCMNSGIAPGHILLFFKAFQRPLIWASACARIPCMKPINPQLQEFIDAGKLKGAADESLVALLTRGGWPAADVYAAIGKYWERTTGIAVPERAAHGESSRDAFLYLLSFSTLATWATALGSLLFALINHWLPDAVSATGEANLRSSLTWQLACIAVAFPIYLAVMRTIVRETSADLERLQSGVRRWLTWLALLLTAGTMIGDLICFLDFFLTGELTLRFVLKCAVVFVIAGAIFAYYIASLRRTPPEPDAPVFRRDLAFAAGAAIAVVTVFWTALAVAGTPLVQRKIEADNRRVEELRRIAANIHNAYVQNHALPATLPAAEASDPETRATYEYRPATGSRYELCAVFNSQSQHEAGAFWNHSPGRNCFTLDASQIAPF